MMSNATATAPAGWYPDPNLADRQRYWDGSAWTRHEIVTQAPASFPPANSDRLKEDLAAEAKWARIGRYALIGGAISFLALFASYMIDVANNTMIMNSVQQTIGADGQTHTSYMNGINFANGPIPALINLAIIVFGVLFMVWMFHAARVSKGAGVPSKMAPGMAIGGWFIPIANYGLPCASALGMFPKGHTARTIVGWWWTTFVAMVVCMYMVGWFAYIGVAASLTVGVIGIALGIVALILALKFMAAVKAFHRERFAIDNG